MKGFCKFEKKEEGYDMTIFRPESEEDYLDIMKHIIDSNIWGQSDKWIEFPYECTLTNRGWIERLYSDMSLDRFPASKDEAIEILLA